MSSPALERCSYTPLPSEDQPGPFSWDVLRPWAVKQRCLLVQSGSPSQFLRALPPGARCFGLSSWAVWSGCPGPGLGSPAHPRPHPASRQPALPSPPHSGPPLWNNLAVVFTTFSLAGSSIWNTNYSSVGFLFTRETSCSTE